MGKRRIKRIGRQVAERPPLPWPPREYCLWRRDGLQRVVLAYAVSVAQLEKLKGALPADCNAGLLYIDKTLDVQPVRPEKLQGPPPPTEERHIGLCSGQEREPRLPDWMVDGDEEVVDDYGEPVEPESGVRPVDVEQAVAV